MMFCFPVSNPLPQSCEADTLSIRAHREQVLTSGLSPNDSQTCYLFPNRSPASDLYSCGALKKKISLNV